MSHLREHSLQLILPFTLRLKKKTPLEYLTFILIILYFKTIHTHVIVSPFITENFDPPNFEADHFMQNGDDLVETIGRNDFYIETNDDIIRPYTIVQNDFLSREEFQTDDDYNFQSR